MKEKEEACRRSEVSDYDGDMMLCFEEKEEQKNERHTERKRDTETER